MKRARPGLDRAASVEALLTEAAGHYAEGRLTEAALAYERAEAAADDVRAIYSLAVIDIRRRAFPDARGRLRKVTRLRPDLFGAWHNLGVAEQALGAWTGAAEAYAAALRLQPQADETHFALAIALAVVGRITEAGACYKALAGRPATRLRALTRLAFLAPGAMTLDEIRDLDNGAAEATAPAEIRAERLFALGEALEARGEHDLAFDAFDRANGLKHAALSAGPPAGRPGTQIAAHAASADRVRRVFSEAFLARHAGEGVETFAPIFIVGAPRSGSSLIEQILASHPGVRGLGETLALGAVLDGPFPYRDGAPGPRPFARLAQAYLDALVARGWRSDRRPVDKTLENHLHVGAICLMFPRAVILHSLRDPVDTCLACYRQNFAVGAETLYDLAEIGAEYVRYRQVMDHWRALLPGRVIDLQYEDLVAAPEARIRWLVTEACGLDWSDACLQFHDTARPVLTASAAQVRRPIYRSSVARWRRHQHRLGPLFEALGPYAPRDL